jgi:hypothetical protein
VLVPVVFVTQNVVRGSCLGDMVNMASRLPMPFLSSGRLVLQEHGTQCGDLSIRSRQPRYDHRVSQVALNDGTSLSVEQQFLFLNGNMRLLQRHILAAAQRLTKALYHAVPVTQPEFRVDKVPCSRASSSLSVMHSAVTEAQQPAHRRLHYRGLLLLPSFSLFHHRRYWFSSLENPQ